MSFTPYYFYSKRESANNASRGPSSTFACPSCGHFKPILGRKRVAGAWKCAGCQRVAA